MGWHIVFCIDGRIGVRSNAEDRKTPHFCIQT